MAFLLSMIALAVVDFLLPQPQAARVAIDQN